MKPRPRGTSRCVSAASMFGANLSGLLSLATITVMSARTSRLVDARAASRSSSPRVASCSRLPSWSISCGVRPPGISTSRRPAPASNARSSSSFATGQRPTRRGRRVAGAGGRVRAAPAPRARSAGDAGGRRPAPAVPASRGRRADPLAGRRGGIARPRQHRLRSSRRWRRRRPQPPRRTAAGVSRRGAAATGRTAGAARPPRHRQSPRACSAPMRISSPPVSGDSLPLPSGCRFTSDGDDAALVAQHVGAVAIRHRGVRARDLAVRVGRTSVFSGARPMVPPVSSKLAESGCATGLALWAVTVIVIMDGKRVGKSGRPGDGRSRTGCLAARGESRTAAGRSRRRIAPARIARSGCG